MSVIEVLGSGWAAATLGAAACGAACWALDRQRRDLFPTSTPSEDEREAAARKLWSVYPDFPDDEPDTALFLLEESRRHYDSWVESNARIEAKATWLTGFLAGGAGLLTVFGSTQGDKTHVTPGPFLFLAIVAAFGALLSCVYIVRPKLRSHPSASAYVSPLAAFSSKSRFHIALSLAEEYNRASIELAGRRRFDPVAWTIAQGSLLLAAFAILVHFAVQLDGRAPPKTVISCKAQTGTFRTGAAAKIVCEDRSSAG